MNKIMQSAQEQRTEHELDVESKVLEYARGGRGVGRSALELTIDKVFNGDDSFIAARALREHDEELTELYNSDSIPGIASHIDSLERIISEKVDAARVPGIKDDTISFTPGGSGGNSFLITSSSYNGSLGGGTPSNSLRIGH